MKGYSALKTSATQALSKRNLKKAEKECRKLVKLNLTDHGVYALQGIVNLKQPRLSTARCGMSQFTLANIKAKLCEGAFF